jgi:glycosyltransferase involved in cell wall biosynthesis
MRLLMLGSVNHPHVEHLALAMHDRGLDVTVAGDVVPSLPASVLPAAGVPVRPAPALPRRTPRGAATHVRWIRGLGRELAPDVVHAHWVTGFAALAAAARVSPLVAMAWGSDVLCASRARTVVNRLALRGADIAMADSRALLDRLVALGVPADRTVLVNWGVDLGTFAPVNGTRDALRARLGLGAGPVLLSPRSLAPVYNPRVILDAFARVAECLADAELVLKHMGDGPAAVGPLPPGVRVVGHVPYEQMAWYYQAADACLSIPSSDSSPRSVWEAMACGCPVVVSDLPWVRELIEPDRHAVVVPVDAGAVADGVLRVLCDPALADRLARRGRALAETHRDQAAEMDRLAGVYRALAA